jgi:GTP-binding protein LepA
MDLEQERGITIKSHPIRMDYQRPDGNRRYVLNLIDTPGHVDFHVRGLAQPGGLRGGAPGGRRGAGVQAQTINNLYLALEHDLEIIPVINKIDLAARAPST